MQGLNFPPIGASEGISSGPAANRQRGLMVTPQDYQQAQQKVYETNKKYQDYIEEFGSKKIVQTRDVYSKLQDIVKNRGSGMKQLYGLSDEDIKTNILVDPKRISPLLKVLDDENQTLRDELDKAAHDLIKFTSMVEQLIQENKAVSQHLRKRDLEQKNFAETIELNKAEDVQDYRLQIQTLQEENNLLVRHLEDMRLNQQDVQIEQLQQELANSKDLYEQLKQNFDFAREREEDLARQLQLLQPKYSQAMDSMLEIEVQKESLEEELAQVQNKNLILTNKVELIDKEFNEKVRNLQVQLDQTQIQLQNYKTDKQNNVLQITDLERVIEDLRREKQMLIRERDEFQQISDQLFTRGKDIKNQLEVEKIRFNHHVGKDKDASTQVQRLAEENAKLELQVRDIKRLYENLQSETRREMDSNNLQSQRILENLKIKYSSSISNLNDEITQLQGQLNRNYEAQEILRKELDISLVENSKLKNQLKDIQQLKRIIDGQQVEIRQLKLDLQDLKLQSQTNEEKFQLDRDDYQQTIKKLQKEIHSQKLQIQELNIQLKDHQETQMDQESLRQVHNNLKEDLRKVIDENERLKDEITEITKHYETSMQVAETLRIEIENNRREDRINQFNQQDYRDLMLENKELRAQLNNAELRLRNQFRTNIPIVRADQSRSRSPQA